MLRGDGVAERARNSLCKGSQQAQDYNQSLISHTLFQSLFKPLKLYYFTASVPALTMKYFKNCP